jgi:hypothetical protein
MLNGSKLKENETGEELIPFATTTREYVPFGRFSGTMNSVETTLVPVITPVLLQL